MSINTGTNVNSFMDSKNGLWITYSLLGLVCSLLITFLFDAFPQIAIISNEGIVFGIMVGTMGIAINKALGVSKES